MPDTIRFEYYSGHLTQIPVELDDARPSRFIFDTGSGVPVVSTPILSELGHSPTGADHRGQRMSGQEIATPIYELTSLRVAGLRRAPVPVAAWDLSGLPADPTPLDGILSLGIFDRTPVSVDYRAQSITIEDESSMGRRLEQGRSVPVEVVRNGPELEVFARLTLPSGRRIRVEVDTGSDLLILHERFRAELGVEETAATTVRTEGSDETGHRYVRYRAPVRGPVAVADAPSIVQMDPTVVFQSIIYDGLVGRDFLRQAPVTFDVTGSRMVFAEPGPRPRDRAIGGVSSSQQG